MQSLIREPLLGFALAGGLIFLLYGVVAEPELEQIVVAPSIVAALEEEHRVLTGRPVTTTERDILIQRYIDEEILVRAAYAEGLDRRDGRVRQQLISKMTFLIDEEPPEPGADALQALYESDPAAYRKPATVDVIQLSLAVGKLSDSARAALEQGDSAPEALGDVSRAHAVSEIELAAVLGQDSAHGLMNSPLDRWQGPFSTPAGELLVQVVARQPATAYSGAQLKRYLREDWLIAQRQALRRQKLDSLKRQYRIQIELPDDALQLAGS